MIMCPRSFYFFSSAENFVEDTGKMHYSYSTGNLPLPVYNLNNCYNNKRKFAKFNFSIVPIYKIDKNVDIYI